MRHLLLKLALSGVFAAGIAGMARADCEYETIAEAASTPVEVAVTEESTSQTSSSAPADSVEVASSTRPASTGVSRPISQPVIPIGTPMRQPITPSVPQPPARITGSAVR